MNESRNPTAKAQILRQWTHYRRDVSAFVSDCVWIYDATAQDWARFGLLHLRDGVWEGERLLPEGWVDHGRRVRSIDETDGSLYGAHWWIDQLDTARGTFRASGYEGQMVAICPPLDAVVVRLGHTPEPQPIPAHLPPWRKRVLDTLA